MQELIAHAASQPGREAPAPAYIRRILAAFAAPAEVRSHELSNAVAALDAAPVGATSYSAQGGAAPETLAASLFVADVHDLAPVEPLTARELEILVLIGERLSDKEIAHMLAIATSTVHRHVANICGKLGVNRRWDAFAKAQALGLLPR